MVSELRAFPDGTRIVTFEQDDGSTVVRLEADGKELSRTSIFPYLMRIGEAVLRMDGIGGVATGEEYRYRGYSRRVLEAAVEWMRNGDAALATLYGIPDYYPKFGFATCGPEYTVILPLSEEVPPPSLPEGWTFRDFTPGDPGDLPAVQEIYRSTTGHASGAIVREGGDSTNAAARKISARPWEILAAEGFTAEGDACRVLLNEGGDLVGYLWIGLSGWWVQTREPRAPEVMRFGEALARDPRSADVLVEAARLWAGEVASETRQIEFIIPPEGHLAQALAYRAGIYAARYTWEGEFMARVLDVERFVRQLLPELAAQVRAARLPLEGALTIRTDEGEVTLAIGADGVTLGGPGSGGLVVELPQAILARIAMGAFEVRDVIARLDNAVDDDAVALLEVLFPRRYPHIYAMDRF